MLGSTRTHTYRAMDGVWLKAPWSVLHGPYFMVRTSCNYVMCKSTKLALLGRWDGGMDSSTTIVQVANLTRGVVVPCHREIVVESGIVD